MVAATGRAFVEDTGHHQPALADPAFEGVEFLCGEIAEGEFDLHRLRLVAAEKVVRVELFGGSVEPLDRLQYARLACAVAADQRGVGTEVYRHVPQRSEVANAGIDELHLSELPHLFLGWCMMTCSFARPA